MVRRATERGHKLQYRWIGPRRVTKIVSEVVFEVSNLLTNKAEVVHASRLRFFSAAKENSEVPSYFIDHAEHSEAIYDTVEKISSLREVDSKIWVQLQWENPKDEVEQTWHPLQEVNVDIPDMLKNYLKKCKTKIARKALNKLQ